MSSASGLFRRALKAGIVACLCGFIVIGTTLLYVLSQFDGNAVFPADCAVVFGTAVRPVIERGEIVYTGAGPGIMRRVETAARLYKEGNVSRIFLAGGRGEGMEVSEAEVMRRYAIVQGVHEEDVVVEDKSRSTKENLLFTKELAGECEHTVAVSDRYHLARIRMLAWQMGWPVQIYPADRHADWRFETHSVIREIGGIVVSLLPL